MKKVLCLMVCAMLMLGCAASAERGVKDWSMNVLKKSGNHNPISVHDFGADPWAMEADGRVWVYMTGDEPMFGGGKVVTNTYGNIASIRVLSSSDMVNWMHYPDIKAAGLMGAAKWAHNSWAPAAAHKVIDGQDKYFLYFADNGSGIGVLVADSPEGPYKDPIGKQLISRKTPTCDSVTWLFDPAVLVDGDDAYIYFGGGIPGDKAEDPGTARVCKLGADMVSLDGDPVPFNPPWLFEDSGINRFGDTYCYSYCSNFNVPQRGSAQGFYSGEIVYMTSNSPMGPFTFAGRVLYNPGSMFGVGGNNHHCMFEFRGKTYIAYHAAVVDKELKWNAGYRSTLIDELKMENGLPALTRGTLKGVEQVAPVNPYTRREAAEYASEAAIDLSFKNGAAAVSAKEAGGFIVVEGVDFGQGAQKLLLETEGEGEIAVYADGTLLGRGNSIPTDVQGEIKQLKFVFETTGISLLGWKAE